MKHALYEVSKYGPEKTYLDTFHAVVFKVNNKSSEIMGKTMLKVDTLVKESLKSTMFKQHLFVQIHQWKTPKQYVKSTQS